MRIVWNALWLFDFSSLPATKFAASQNARFLDGFTTMIYEPIKTPFTFLQNSLFDEPEFLKIASP
jgi:hypothetical protein